MQRRTLSKLSLWLPPTVWALIIFALSSLSVTPAPDVYWKDFVVKKSAHVIEYGILAVLLFRAIVGSGIPRQKALFWAAAIAVCYGVTDEIHQGFTPGREPTVRDVFFDTIGAKLGLFLWQKYL